MLALREHRHQFLADGDVFHTSFGKMLRVASPDFPRVAYPILENFDPVFGVYPEAGEMIFEGIRDHILALERPALRVARFIIRKEDAAKELLELPRYEVYKRLATGWDADLGSPQ